MLPGLEQLLAECAPRVAPDTMTAIVRVESGGNPLALNVNGDQRLARQPKNKQEALGWSSWLIARGYSIDIGLAQVNSRNLQRLGVTSAQMFEPCDNLKAGARIFPKTISARASAMVPVRMHCAPRFQPITPAIIKVVLPMAMLPKSMPVPVSRRRASARHSSRMVLQQEKAEQAAMLPTEQAADRRFCLRPWR